MANSIIQDFSTHGLPSATENGYETIILHEFDTVFVKAGEPLSEQTLFSQSLPKGKKARSNYLPYNLGRVCTLKACSIDTNIKYDNIDIQRLWEQTTAVKVKVEDKDYPDILMANHLGYKRAYKENKITTIPQTLSATNVWEDNTTSGTTRNIYDVRESDLIPTNINGIPALYSDIELPQAGTAEFKLTNNFDFVNTSTEGGILGSVLNQTFLTNLEPNSKYYYMLIRFIILQNRTLK